jgi:hypothetical protein
MKRGLGASALRRSAKALEFRQASVYRITGSRLRGRGADNLPAAQHRILVAHVIESDAIF